MLCACEVPAHAHAFRVHSVSFQGLEDPGEPLALRVLHFRAAHLESQNLDGGRVDSTIFAALGRVRLARCFVHRLDLCHSLTCGCDEQSETL